MDSDIVTHGTKTDPGWHFLHRPLGLVLVVIYKGLWGMAEFAAGILLIFSYKIVAGELTEDPQDIFINWLIQRFHMDFKTLAEIGILVSLLGIGKLALAIGLWYRSYLMRSIGLVFFILFALFAIYELGLKFSVFKFLALSIDLFIIYYFWKILPKHFRHGEVV